MFPMFKTPEIGSTAPLLRMPHPDGRGLPGGPRNPNTGIVPPARIPRQVDPFSSLFHGGNSGVVPPGLPGIFSSLFHPRANSGVVPPRPVGAPWAQENGRRPTPMPIPDRLARMSHLLPFKLGIVTGAYPGLGDDVSITLPDLTANISAGSTGQMVPNFTPIMPAVPVTPVLAPVTAPDTGSGSWGALFSNVLGGALKLGTTYEMGRLQSRLLQKTYNPQTVAANIQAYQGAAAQTAAQAQAEQMARELEFERQTGARAGTVVSSGVVILGLAGLAAFLLFRKPSASRKAA